jgi:hypothetical protein
MGTWLSLVVLAVPGLTETRAVPKEGVMASLLHSWLRASDIARPAHAQRTTDV